LFRQKLIWSHIIPLDREKNQCLFKSVFLIPVLGTSINSSLVNKGRCYILLDNTRLLFSCIFSIHTIMTFILDEYMTIDYFSLLFLALGNKKATKTYNWGQRQNETHKQSKLVIHYYNSIFDQFQRGLFLRITTLLSWLKSTLILKNKCFDTHIYMKVQCLQTKWESGKENAWEAGWVRKELALIKSLICPRWKRCAWGTFDPK